MKRNRNYPLGLFVLISAVLACVLASPAGAKTFATWTDTSGDHSYANPANWDIGVVPINSGTVTYNVSIGSSKTVTNVPSGTVDSFSLGSSSNFTVGLGSTYTALGSVVVGGNLTAVNGHIVASNTGGAFSGNTTRLAASDGGTITLGAPSMSTAGLKSGGSLYDIIKAEGPGSVVSLPDLWSLSANFSDNSSYQTIHRVWATSGGHIDLSGLQRIKGADRSEDYLQINYDNGSIDLASLRWIESGHTRFLVSGAVCTLTSLESAVGTTFQTSYSTLPTATEINLPTLTDHNGGSYIVHNAKVVNAPMLSTANSLTLDVRVGGEYHAPLMTSFTRGVMNLDDGEVIDVPAFVNFDDTLLSVSGGRQYAVAGTGYASTNLKSGGATYLLFSAGGTSGTGTPSRLDLSSLLSLNAGFSDNSGYTTVHRVQATTGAEIDFAGLQTIAGPTRSEDRLEFIVNTGGSMDFSSLQSLPSGHVKFDVDAPAFELPALQSTVGTTFALAVPTMTLPALQTASSTTFNLSAGTALSTPTLTSHNGGTYSVAAGASLAAPALQSANGVTIDVATGGTFEAPNLTTFTGGVFTRRGGQTINLPEFVNINNSRLSVLDGESLTVAAVDYVTTDLKSGGSTYTLLSASGVSTATPATPSTLSLPSLTTLNAAFDDSSGYATVHKVTAADGGVVDLSGLQSITGPTRSEDRLDFIASSGGRIDLSSLRSASGSKVRFIASGGGRMSLGDMTVNSNVTLSVSDGTSEVDVLENLHISSSGSFAVTGGAKVTVGGDFSYAMTSESAFNGDAAILQMTDTGAGIQWLEVGGADLGVDGSTSGNFGLGQLIVGDTGEEAVVFLTDWIDNGNRASREAMYLYGSGGADGIEILGGSTLLLGDINAYALVSGTMVHLNGLIGGGEYYADFGGGSIGNPVPGDANLDRAVNVFDLAILANNYGGSGKDWGDADFTGEGDVDVFDLAALANNYGWTATGGSPIPEPAMLALLAAGGLAALRRRRRRCGEAHGASWVRYPQ